MAKPTHDLAIKTGEYADAEGTRGRWLRVGTMVRHDDGGISIKLDALPVGLPGWDGWINVFRRDREPPRGRRPAQPAPDAGDDPDDGIVF